MATIGKFQEILDERDAIKKAAKLDYLHWFILSLSLVLTFGAWHYTKSQVEERKISQFQRESEQVIDLVTERLQKYEDTLWSGVASIHAQNLDIDYYDWKRFASTLKIEKRYMGINGIGVIYKLDDKQELAELIEKERQIRPDFQVHPLHQHQEYWPIVYIEPIATNSKAVGLDMAHEKNRYEAAQKARDTGMAQITGPITLVQDTKSTPGFLFFAPFYSSSKINTTIDRRELFIGMVYAPFIMNKLMNGTLDESKRQVGVSIHDEKEALYFEDKPENLNLGNFVTTANVDLYGRTWTFEIWAKQSFFDSNKNSKPMIILIGGLIIDALILAFFLFLTNSNRRTIEFADRLAESYKIKNEELVDAENFQERILENIPDIIFVKDEEYKIVKANKAFMDLYPKNKRDKIIGYTTLEEYDEDEAHQFLKHDKEALEKGFSETLEKISFPNGSVETLHTKKIGFNNSQGKRFMLGVGHNITDLKKAEEELINSNLELERFAYVAAHDMQEPARIVKGFAEILEQDYLDKLDEQGQVYLRECISGAKQIQDLINDLLEYSRITHHSDSLENVDMNNVVKDAIANLQNIIEEKKAEITVAENLPHVMGNNMRCIRLMQNLISNALKYQPDAQIPIVNISFIESDDSYVFSVKDNGIGIDKKYHNKIFEPFKKLHHHSTYKGTGIGLPICKKIVQTMDGKLWVESTIGKGATFYFSLNKPQT